ncbi:MAG: Ycf66 family protein [Cyanobacteriota bacterium]|nr:Ycf66 family protein [Cyanobacteriota bacterium]
MVNASLNWASIVGIVLAVGGALLYFMRSFKPALARDYDVFFAAIGLLCGGILFFQGWRLDPILQFGQFLLAGTTVFFAYESVRLRGVATEQARRSAYFDDEPAPPREAPGGLRGGWDDRYDSFDEPQPLRRRFSGQEERFDDEPLEESYRPRRTSTSRAAIPEQAESRRGRETERPTERWARQDDERSRRMARFRAGDEPQEKPADFGDRRTQRQDQRSGSRPIGRTAANSAAEPRTSTAAQPNRSAAEDASFSAKQKSTVSRPSTSRPAPRSSRSSGPASRPRDNSSRFDD